MHRFRSWLCASSLCVSLLLVHPLPGLAYQVQPGDCLWGISQQYGISVSRLEEANGLSADSILHLGQDLTIPGQHHTAPATATYQGSTGTYTVQSGDTLWAVAQRYGTSVDSLISVNDLTSDALQIGQVLRVPGGTSTPAGGSPEPAAKPVEVSRGTGPLDQMVAYALKFQGDRYRFGGGSPSGFDCSGFVKYVFAAFGINLPHTSYGQYDLGTPVNRSQLQPGDLVFFDTYGGVSHSGIYVGNGRFISATTSDGVAVESLDGGYWGTRYVGARRV